MAYSLLRAVSVYGTKVYFNEIAVLGYENLPPPPRPCLVASTHCNMIVDPMVLVATAPYKRIYGFWAKGSLFKNRIARFLMTSVGAVPVDRTNKNNDSLFRSSLDRLAAGGVVVVFPEGTSYTLPHIIDLKDGISWTALEHITEYVDHQKEQGSTVSSSPKKIKARRAKKGISDDTGIETKADEKIVERNQKRGGNVMGPCPAVVVPVGITYVQKAKWRSAAIVHYAKPIELLPFVDEFRIDPRGAVKQLTALITERLREVTINSLDWDTFWAAETAREILIPMERINLENFVPLTQRLVNVLTYPGPDPDDDKTKKGIMKIRNQLLLYRSGLLGLRLRDKDVSDLIRHRIPILHAAFRFLGLSILASIEGVIFLPGYVTLAPILVASRMAERKVQDVESKSQVKLITATFLTVILYGLLFWLGIRNREGHGGWWNWGLGLRTRHSIGLLFVLGTYHAVLIENNFSLLRDAIGQWKVLRAVWRGWIGNFTKEAQKDASDKGRKGGKGKDKHVVDEDLQVNTVRGVMLLREECRLQLEALDLLKGFKA